MFCILKLFCESRLINTQCVAEVPRSFREKLVQRVTPREGLCAAHDTWRPVLPLINKLTRPAFPARLLLLSSLSVSKWHPCVNCHGLRAAIPGSRQEGSALFLPSEGWAEVSQGKRQPLDDRRRLGKCLNAPLRPAWLLSCTSERERETPLVSLVLRLYCS